MNVTFIGDRIGHHAGHSGYDQLAAHIPSRRLGSNTHNFISKIVRTLPNRLIEPLLDADRDGWYRKKSQLAREIQAMGVMCFRKSIHHWLYGENDFRHGGNALRRSGSRVVVSFHQPPGVFSSLFSNIDFVQKADAIITCSAIQKDFFQGVVKSAKVHFIHHGVDAEFFSPGPNIEKDDEFSLVFVGSWLRDLKTLCKVIEKSNRLFNGVSFGCFSRRPVSNCPPPLPASTMGRSWCEWRLASARPLP